MANKMIKPFGGGMLLFLAFSCAHPPKKTQEPSTQITETSLIVLGAMQDGGAPHIGCKKDCCKDLFLHPDANRKVVSIGIIDPENKKNFLFEATPDISTQLKNLQRHSGFSTKETPDAIFLTHAHIGHYAGLMYLGKEAMDADKVKVYAMPRMKSFLENNGPWSQLVKLNNIDLQPINADEKITLTPNIKVTPFKVPHRDEYSETVCYLIEGKHKKVLFIPDINKWEKWERNIAEAITKVDYAFLDATFYDGEELNNRNMLEIPHPFILESMKTFKNLPANQKSKIYFIHFNHTNPVLNHQSKQYKTLIENGFKVAEVGMVLGM
ncbi:MAG: MBL fold metallo-hydrolase [Bacteroidetes bacterium]|nr:MBL fold metallo-hydrolase [Bacteroidota bacterium]